MAANCAPPRPVNLPLRNNGLPRSLCGQPLATIIAEGVKRSFGMTRAWLAAHCPVFLALAALEGGEGRRAARAGFQCATDYNRQWIAVPKVLWRALFVASLRSLGPSLDRWLGQSGAGGGGGGGGGCFEGAMGCQQSRRAWPGHIVILGLDCC